MIAIPDIDDASVLHLWRMAEALEDPALRYLANQAVEFDRTAMVTYALWISHAVADICGVDPHEAIVVARQTAEEHQCPDNLFP